MDPGSFSSNATNQGVHPGSSVPTAAILCLALGAYIIVMLLALLIRRYLKTHDLKGVQCCNKDNPCSGCSCSGCRQCWGLFEDAVKSLCCCCCDGQICQKFKCEKKCECFDNCFPSCEDLSWPCCSGVPSCECGRCNCTCACQLPKCRSINCCCFKINIAS